jgi:hypothetical protein
MKLRDIVPSVLDLRVDVFVTESGTGPEERLGRFTLDSLRETVPCTNPRCRRGGLSLRFSLDGMVRTRQQHGEFSKVCPGDEGSSQGRVRGKKCLNSFRAAVQITYHPGPHTA